MIFTITNINTSKNNNFIKQHIEDNLNYMYYFSIDKNSIDYKNMLLASNGLMFVYTFTECGKDDKIKKRG